MILALGSNLGDRREHLSRGLAFLGAGVAIEVVSRLVESRPWGPVVDQPDFLNLVIRGRTELDPVGLLDLVRRAEEDAGRARRIVQGPRTLDVDIIFFGRSRILSEALQVPHPRWTARPFVAGLLGEVAGEMIDPVSGRPVSDLVRDSDFSEGLDEVEPLEWTADVSVGR